MLHPTPRKVICDQLIHKIGYKSDCFALRDLRVDAWRVAMSRSNRRSEAGCTERFGDGNDQCGARDTLRAAYSALAFQVKSLRCLPG